MFYTLCQSFPMPVRHILRNYSVESLDYSKSLQLSTHPLEPILWNGNYLSNFLNWQVCMTQTVVDSGQQAISDLELFKNLEKWPDILLIFSLEYIEVILSWNCSLVLIILPFLVLANVVSFVFTAKSQGLRAPALLIFYHHSCACFQSQVFPFILMTILNLQYFSQASYFFPFTLGRQIFHLLPHREKHQSKTALAATPSPTSMGWLNCINLILTSFLLQQRHSSQFRLSLCLFSGVILPALAYFLGELTALSLLLSNSYPV